MQPDRTWLPRCLAHQPPGVWHVRPPGKMAFPSRRRAQLMAQPTENPNPFAPPKAQIGPPTKARRGGGKLMPHEKAGRVIRLMAVLSLVGAVGIGAAVLLPTMSSGKPPHFAEILLPAVVLALVIGLFFVGSAVMRHESWARTVGIIYGLVALLGFPIGTLVGAYVLWQLVFQWNDAEDPA